MSTTNKRSLSKTSWFTSEILMEAPADLDVVRDSKKYQDLRADLNNAVKLGAWGIQIILTAETEIELRHQIRNLSMAAKSWERRVELLKTHGLKIAIHYVIANNKLEAPINVYFKGIDPES